ncbi:MAG: thioredoxin-dependent thiol peroxidase [Rickettsiales bacterium]
MNELKIGDTVTNFTLSSDQQESVSISDFHGKNIILYFYPKDDTPGCTIEAKDFSCLTEEFSKLNTVIIGISKDDIKSHAKFRVKHDLKHILLADPNLDIIKQFNCWVEKSMYGKKYMGVARKTFLINKEGLLERIWPDVKIKDHAEEVLSVIKNMSK